MSEQKSFKERVRDEAIRCAIPYKDYFVGYEYLVCSEAFIKKPYYIIQAHSDNYMHLTGVVSNISAEAFFSKCCDGTLSENDFSFIKRGKTEAEVKGSVRRKINALPHVTSVFGSSTVVEEDFTKNRIRCAFAAGRTECTLGFTATAPTKPMTLLKANQLDANKSKAMSLVLRRKTGEEAFHEFILGGEPELTQYFDEIKDMLSEELKSLVHIKKVEIAEEQGELSAVAVQETRAAPLEDVSVADTEIVGSDELPRNESAEISASI